MNVAVASDVVVGTDAQGFLFRKGQAVLHVKSNGRYIIAILPDQGVIEATGEPAYAYIGDNSKIYFRCQAEMEDGRFQALDTEPKRFIPIDLAPGEEMVFDDARIGAVTELAFPDTWETVFKTFTVTEVKRASSFGSGLAVRVHPTLQQHHPHGDKVWYDSNHFKIFPQVDRKPCAD